MFSEGHRLAAEGSPAEILSDHDLLIACNLMHVHRHSHADEAAEHSHPHIHYPLHEHRH